MDYLSIKTRLNGAQGVSKDEADYYIAESNRRVRSEIAVYLQNAKLRASNNKVELNVEPIDHWSKSKIWE